MIGLSNSAARYGWVSMALHWSIVVIFAVSVWYAYSRGFIPREERELRRAIMMLHFDWSWALMVPVLARIAWRFMSTQPKDINDDKRLILAHKLVVGSLAWFPVALTLSGAGVIWAAGRDVQAFGVTLLAGLPESDRSLHDVMEVAHVGLWYLFAAVLLLHVGAALWHHRVKKDDTLNRMLPWGKVG